MEQALLILAGIFFVVAFAYASVGLGGGSSYTALMTIFGLSITAIPFISLSLNLMVTTVGSYNFIRKGHARLKLILPFVITSIPMSYIGGMLKLPKDVFYWVLMLSLMLVALRIYFSPSTSMSFQLGAKGKLIVSLIAGSILGLIAGIAGIGGGIYLIPLILVLGLGNEKEAAACGVIFVWLNSLSGLISRAQYNFIDITGYYPLFIAVLAGGALGSFMGATKFSSQLMNKILGVIILVAIFFLARKLFFS